VAHEKVSATTVEEVITMMTGRAIDQDESFAPRRPPGEPIKGKDGQTDS
jgi:hypothetical protein